MTNTNKLTPGSRAVLGINARRNRTGGYAPRCYYLARWGRALPVKTERGEPVPVRAILRAAARSLSA